MSERIGYKIVTQDMESLGLRRNPNILTYPVGEWFRLPDDQVEEGPGDWGGIWVAKTVGMAHKYKKYMKDQHGEDTHIFEAELGRTLYESSGRIKTDAVLLRREIP